MSVTTVDITAAHTLTVRTQAGHIPAAVNTDTEATASSVNVRIHGNGKDKLYYFNL